MRNRGKSYASNSSVEVYASCNGHAGFGEYTFVVCADEYDPGNPGRLSGPPEDCYPPEPDSVEPVTSEVLCFLGDLSTKSKVSWATMLEAVADEQGFETKSGRRGDRLDQAEDWVLDKLIDECRENYEGYYDDHDCDD